MTEREGASGSSDIGAWKQRCAETIERLLSVIDVTKNRSKMEAHGRILLGNCDDSSREEK
jgi:hypothetical protein